MHPKDVEGMANSVDPDQTAPIPVELLWTCFDEDIALSNNKKLYKLYQKTYRTSPCITHACA